MTLGEIDALWDFSDPAGSENRFRLALSCESDPVARAEIQTQIARTFSLRRRFEECHAELDEISADLQDRSARLKIRWNLEMGRCLRSQNEADSPLPHFKFAFELGSSEGLLGLAADAAHMVALVVSTDESIRWNERILELAELTNDPGVLKWRASVHNNLGWTYHELGQFQEALRHFEQQLELRQGGPEENIRIAKWCVARVLRSLGRNDEALAIQNALVLLQPPSGYTHEELGELFLLAERNVEAAEQFGMAAEILSADAQFVAEHPERIQRMKRLAHGN